MTSSKRQNGSVIFSCFLVYFCFLSSGAQTQEIAPPSTASPDSFQLTDLYESVESSPAHLWIRTERIENPENQLLSITESETLAPPSPLRLEVFPEIKKHELWGFGGAVTESCLSIVNALSLERQNQFHEILFSPRSGANLTLLRLPLGGNDFSNGDYSLNDIPTDQTDPDLQFMQYESLQSAIQWIQNIYNLYGSKRVMVTPWTPPAWMKDNKSLRGGQLKKEYYSTYASYLLKATEHLQKQSVDVRFLSVLNEPLIDGAWDYWNYPQAYMSLIDQRDFFENAMIPAIQKKMDQGLTPPQILLYDHNWDRATEAIEVLEPLVLNHPQIVAGLANHCYGGELEVQKLFHRRWPLVPTLSSECTGNLYSTEDEFDFQWWLQNLTVDSIQAGSRGALSWNLCLDEKGGPHNDGCDTCRGLLTINRGQEKITPNPEYYALAQVSRYIEPNARVIHHQFNDSTVLRALTIENPETDIVVIVRNPSLNAELFSIGPNPLFPRETIEILPRSALTLRYKKIPH